MITILKIINYLYFKDMLCFNILILILILIYLNFLKIDKLHNISQQIYSKNKIFELQMLMQNQIFINMKNEV